MAARASLERRPYNAWMSASATTPPTDERERLRKELRARRRAVSPAERIAAAQSLAAQLLALPFSPARGYVAGYWAMDGEIALHAWQLGLPAAVTYCLPVLHDEGSLRFAPWRPGLPLKSNRYDIPEPDVPTDALVHAQQLQLVVTPLVGFDREGRRLGMGAAWYDRSFGFRQHSTAPPWLVGAAFAQQEVDSLPVAPWDVDLDAICTEHATHLVTEADSA